MNQFAFLVNWFFVTIERFLRHVPEKVVEESSYLGGGVDPVAYIWSLAQRLRGASGEPIAKPACYLSLLVQPVFLFICPYHYHKKRRPKNTCSYFDN